MRTNTRGPRRGQARVRPLTTEHSVRWYNSN